MNSYLIINFYKSLKLMDFPMQAKAKQKQKKRVGESCNKILAMDQF